MRRFFAVLGLASATSLLAGCPVYSAESCVDSSDCANGFVCDGARNECVSIDTDGPRCSVSSDCGANHYCGGDGRCAPIDDCRYSGCPGGYVCEASSGAAPRCVIGSKGKGGSSAAGAGGSSVGGSAGRGGSGDAGAGGGVAGAGGGLAGAGGEPTTGGAAGDGAGGQSVAGAGGKETGGSGGAGAGAAGAEQSGGGGQAQAGASQGGGGQAGTSQGGAAGSGIGGAAQGGTSQGGASQGGASQGGASQGGAGGGVAGAGQAGSGDAGAGGADAGGANAGGGGPVAGAGGGGGAPTASCDDGGLATASGSLQLVSQATSTACTGGLSSKPLEGKLAIAGGKGAPGDTWTFEAVGVLASQPEIRCNEDGVVCSFSFQRTEGTSTTRYTSTAAPFTVKVTIWNDGSFIGTAEQVKTIRRVTVPGQTDQQVVEGVTLVMVATAG